MHTERELIRLGFHKVRLQRRIARHRAECAQAAAVLVKPLDWLDRVVAVWRKLSPVAKFAAVPLGLLVQRTVFRRMKGFGAMLRWAPLVVTVVRGVISARRGRA